ADLLAHLVNTNSQYNLPALNKKLVYPANRGELNLPARFTEPSARKMVECDLALIDALDAQIHELERHLVRTAKVHDAQAYARLQSIPGIGKVLGLVLLYEIHDVRRFPEAGHFLSPGWYGRGRSRRARPRASATRRSATPICARHWARRRACTCAP